MRWVRGLAAASVMGTALVAAPPPASAAQGSVVINEVMYHSAVDGRDFLELHNPGDAAVEIGGACFTAGITGCLAGGTTLTPGEYLVVAESPADYAAEHPTAPAPVLDHGGSLSNGGETVTLSLDGQPLDSVTYADSAPWPASPDGDGPSLELVDPLLDNDDPAAWAASDPGPTPGTQNTRYGQGPAPVIGEVEVGPTEAGEPTTVTVGVTGAATVGLEVTIGFDAPTTVDMTETQTGTYEAELPGQPANTLVRYRVRAEHGSATATRPDAGDARPTLGFVVQPTEPPTDLPLLQWFIDPDDLATLLENIETNDYVPAVIAYGGEVWDGAEVRGQGNLRSTPKLSFKVKMPNDHPLVAPGLIDDPVDEFVLDNDHADYMGTSAVIGLDAYAENNPFVPQRAKVRVHRNGGLLGLYTFLEEWEDAFFARVGLDQPGAQVYEPQDTDGVFVDEGSPAALEPRFEQLEGPDDGYDDLYDLVQVIDGPPTPARAALLRDHLDVPALVEFLAMGALLQHWDQTVHNFLVIRDPATGRWRFGPSDLDNAMGQPLRSPGPTAARHGNVFPYGPDNLVSALRSDPVFNEMYFRRLRTLADELLAGGGLEARADALAPLVATDVEDDHQLYDTAFTGAQGRAQLAGYVAFKTQDLLVDHRRDGEVPTATVTGDPVISEIAYAAAGGPGHDFVELHNPSSGAIDLSGWTLDGAATATLPPGTVVPAGGSVVVPGDQEATSDERPSGTLVAGALEDGLADGGGSIALADASGAARGGVTYGTSTPWPTAPAAGTATLERIDPTSPAGGATAWRASATATGSPGSSDRPAGPAPADRLSVEAAADQVETRPGTGSGVGFTVVVTNTGTATRPAVTLAAPGATCPAPVGTLAPGASTTLRCRSLGSTAKDRTYLFTATSGAVQARSAPVQVRTYEHITQYYENHVPAVPTAPQATASGAGRIDLTWTPPTPTNLPPRWVVITECEPGRAVPTGGTLHAPGSSAQLDHLALDQPVQLAIAVRSRSGTGARTTPTPVLTPRSSPVYPFTSTHALVVRLVAAMAGRPANASEIKTWTAAIDGGASPSRIVTEGLARPRWANDVAPVARLYTAYFGRLPDQAGLAYWLERRRAGVGLDTVSSAFARTPEFRSQYGPLPDSAFVARLYRNVFGRQPDAAGQAYWVQRLATGTTRGRVVTSFSESPEGRVLLAPMVQTSLVWTALVGTTPTPAEARPAVDWLAGGGSLLTVVEGLRTSDRYADHVA